MSVCKTVSKPKAAPVKERWLLIPQYGYDEFDTLAELEKKACAEEYQDYYVVKVTHTATTSTRIDLTEFK